eukprot:1635315-Prymnesium_polylepis.1
MLVPSHALYDAGVSLPPLAVFVSTTTANSYVACRAAAAGLSRTSKMPLPAGAACTIKPLPVPPTKPPAGSLAGTSAPRLIEKLSGVGAGEMRSSTNTSVNAGSASTGAAFWPSPPASRST